MVYKSVSIQWNINPIEKLFYFVQTEMEMNIFQVANIKDSKNISYYVNTSNYCFFMYANI